METEVVFQEAVNRIRRFHHQFGDRFPAFGEDSTYKLTANENWLASFWIGLLWLTYAATCDDSLRTHAERLLSSFKDRLNNRVRVNHDLGFLFTLSARAQWQLTGDLVAHHLALRAADELYSRYRPVGKYIQAWGDVGCAEDGGRAIVDTMMNIPLLYWASEQTGKSHYHEAATAHAETTQRYLVRSDGSSYHTFFFNQNTGEPMGPRTHQGYADDSLWARGQAWIIFGFAVAAEWTGHPQFLQTAQQATNRFMDELTEGGVPLWDLRLPAKVPHYPDSSAAAIAASGILRLARLSDEGSQFSAMAMKLLNALVQTCFESNPDAHGLLKHGTLHAIKGWGVDTYQIFGDYFFLEALMMLQHRTPDFWGPTTEKLVL